MIDLAKSIGVDFFEAWSANEVPAASSATWQVPYHGGQSSFKYAEQMLSALPRDELKEMVRAWSAHATGIGMPWASSCWARALELRITPTRRGATPIRWCGKRTPFAARCRGRNCAPTMVAASLHAAGGRSRSETCESKRCGRFGKGRRCARCGRPGCWSHPRCLCGRGMPNSSISVAKEPPVEAFVDLVLLHARLGASMRAARAKNLFHLHSRHTVTLGRRPRSKFEACAWCRGFVAHCLARTWMPRSSRSRSTSVVSRILRTLVGGPLRVKRSSRCAA